MHSEICRNDGGGFCAEGETPERSEGAAGVPRGGNLIIAPPAFGADKNTDARIFARGGKIFFGDKFGRDRNLFFSYASVRGMKKKIRVILFCMSKRLFKRKRRREFRHNSP